MIVFYERVKVFGEEMCLFDLLICCMGRNVIGSVFGRSFSVLVIWFLVMVMLVDSGKCGLCCLIVVIGRMVI